MKNSCIAELLYLLPRIAMGVIVVIALILLLGGCAPKEQRSDPTVQPSNDDHSILTKTIPSQVEGIIVEPMQRIDAVFHYNERGELVSIDEAVYRLKIRVNGVDDVYPVTLETFQTVAFEETVRLDCSSLPCVLEQ